MQEGNECDTAPRFTPWLVQDEGEVVSSISGLLETRHKNVLCPTLNLDPGNAGMLESIASEMLGAEPAPSAPTGRMHQR